MTPVRLEPAAPRSRVKHSTTEPLRSHCVSERIFEKVLILKKSADGNKTMKENTPNIQIVKREKMPTMFIQIVFIFTKRWVIL